MLFEFDSFSRCADGDGLLLNTKEDTKSRGRAVVTLPVLLYSTNIITSSASRSPNPNPRIKPSSYCDSYKQKETTALRELMKLAADRDVWAGLTKELCGVMEKL